MTTPCPLDSSSFSGPLQESLIWKFNNLQKIEDHISTDTCSHPPLKDLILEGSLKGSTPLLVACHRGDLRAVKRMVGHWGVDAQTAAVYHYNGVNYWEKDAKNKTDWTYLNHLKLEMKNVTPLFVAAINCNLGIVRYLVENGADVSARTSKRINNGPLTGLTALQAVIMIPYLEMEHRHRELKEIAHFLIKSGADICAPAPNGAPIWSMEGCNRIDTVSLLIELGMDLNATYLIEDRPTTILHHWICQSLDQEGSLDIIKLLLNKGADIHAKDDDGLTPILAVAIGKRNGVGRASVDVHLLEYLLERNDVDTMEKINALELAGSVILSYVSNHGNQKTDAFKYWHRALELGLTTLPSEWSSRPTLQRLEQNPSEGKLQAILVQLRILSGISLRAVSRYWWPLIKTSVISLRMIGTSAPHPRERERDKSQKVIIEICQQVIETFRWCNQQESTQLWPTLLEICEIYTSIEMRVISTTSLMEIEEDVIKLANNLKLLIEIYYWQLQLGCSSNPLEDRVEASGGSSARSQGTQGTGRNFHFLGGFLRAPHRLAAAPLEDLPSSTLCRIVAILSQLPINIVDQDIMEPLSRIVRNTNQGNQLLMIMIRYDKTLAWERSRLWNHFSTVRHWNPFASVRLLLRAGADPDMVDDNGDSPLHILTRSFEGDLLDSTARLLVDAGVRLNRVNKQMQTVADIWFERHGIREEDRGVSGRICRLPDWCEIKVLTLKCLSAITIRRHRVPGVNKLPISLQTFF